MDAKDGIELMNNLFHYGQLMIAAFGITTPLSYKMRLPAKEAVIFYVGAYILFTAVIK